MTALESMRQELHRVHTEQLSCLNEQGYVVKVATYKYLVKQAMAYQLAIKYLEGKD